MKKSATHGYGTAASSNHAFGLMLQTGNGVRRSYGPGRWGLIAFQLNEDFGKGRTGDQCQARYAELLLQVCPLGLHGRQPRAPSRLSLADTGSQCHSGCPSPVIYRTVHAR